MEPWLLIQARCPAVRREPSIVAAIRCRIASDVVALAVKDSPFFLRAIARRRFVAENACGKPRYGALMRTHDERVVLHKLLEERDDDARLVLGLARERTRCRSRAESNVSFAADTGGPEHQRVGAAENREPCHVPRLLQRRPFCERRRAPVLLRRNLWAASPA